MDTHILLKTPQRTAPPRLSADFFFVTFGEALRYYCESRMKMAGDLLTETYERLRKAFRDSARNILSDADEAEDALQEAFIRLWNKGYQIKQHREAEALIARAIRNESLDRLRRRKRRPQSFTEAGLDQAPEIEAPKDRRQETEQTLKRVEAIIDDELTPLQKRIIRLHEYEGVPLERVAEKLSMNAPAVRMQLSRARKTIRETYRKQNYG